MTAKCNDAAVEPAAPHQASSTEPSRLAAWVERNGALAAILACLAVPFVIAVAWRIGRTGEAQFPVLDPALVELAVRDVGHASVLVGPYSRYGFHHPGPLYFYLLAIPYRLLGSNYAALSVGSALIGAGSAFGIVALSVRRGGRWLGVVAGVLVLSYLAAAGRIAFDAWTPWVTILPFALAIVLAWSLTCGDWWALPVLAGVATLLVQTHVAYTLPIGVVTVTALVVVGIDARAARRDPTQWPERRRSLLRAGAITFGVVALLWLPPLIDQLTTDPGNAREIASFFSKADVEHTLGDGLDETARYVGTLPALLNGDTLSSAVHRDPLAWPTVLTIIAFGAALVVAIRRRAREQLTLLGLTAIAAITAVFAASRVLGPMFPYLVEWITAIGLVAWLAIGAIALRVWQARDRTAGSWTTRRWVRITAAGVSVVLAGVLAVGAAGSAREVDRDADRPAVAQMADGIEARLPGGDRPIGLRVHEIGFVEWPWVAGVLLELRRRGHDVHVVDSGIQSEAIFADRDLVDPDTTPVVVTFRGAEPGTPSDLEVKGIALDVTP